MTNKRRVVLENLRFTTASILCVPLGILLLYKVYNIIYRTFYSTESLGIAYISGVYERYTHPIFIGIVLISLLAAFSAILKDGIGKLRVGIILVYWTIGVLWIVYVIILKFELAKLSSGVK